MKNELALLMVSSLSALACGSSDGGVFGNAGSATGASAGGAGSGGSGASGGGDQGGSSSTSSNVGPGGGPGSGGMSSGPGGTGQGGIGQGGMGQGGGPKPDVGCSDGTREYFEDVAAQPNIAGCSGGFDVAGVTTPGSMQPNCNRISGNSSVNPQGTGCSVEDLCSEGWHVCISAKDVSDKSATQACEPAVAAVQEFWLTRQSMDPGIPTALCAGPPSANNIVGCGTLGDPPGDSCNPLTTRMRYIDCAPTVAWFCGNSQLDQLIEADIVVKVGPEEGGVLCCKN